MYSTNVYNYKQRQIVVLNSGNSPRRYHNVYAKDLTLNRGVDNILQFHILDQEQKPINISDLSIAFRILDKEGKKILLEQTLTNTLPVTGHCQLELISSDLDGISPQKCFYTLQMPNDGLNTALFMNNNAGARGVLHIVDSIMPEFVPSATITIPSHPYPTLLNAVTFYTSVFSTNHQSNLTLQTKLTGYKGTMNVQGSTTGQGDWYDISDVETYNNYSDTKYIHVTGYHPYMRVKCVANAGTLDKVLAR